MPAVSPTLTPNLALPQPLPPSGTSSSQQAEVAFFDKVKKYLSNKQTFAEFLKLCNLFSQDLIDRNVLVHKVSNFIGTNLELMDFFKKFVAYTGPDEIIENRPRAPTGRVALSNCRGLGPSYRLLPRRVCLIPYCLNSVQLLLVRLGKTVMCEFSIAIVCTVDNLYSRILLIYAL
jgi:paired amphipathic helix protein Sin3a